MLPVDTINEISYFEKEAVIHKKKYGPNEIELEEKIRSSNFCRISGARFPG